jgi:putative endonuclease
MERSYSVYILGSNWSVLYTGITNDLERRIYEHRTGQVKGFTQKYGVKRLLYYEEHSDVHDALFREKQIKAWTRKKRVELIQTMNPKFEDLAKGWFSDER